MRFAAMSLNSRYPPSPSATHTGPSASPNLSPSVSSFASGEMIESRAGSNLRILNGRSPRPCAVITAMPQTRLANTPNTICLFVSTIDAGISHTPTECRSGCRRIAGELLGRYGTLHGRGGSFGLDRLRGLRAEEMSRLYAPAVWRPYVDVLIV